MVVLASAEAWDRSGAHQARCMRNANEGQSALSATALERTFQNRKNAGRCAISAGAHSWLLLQRRAFYGYRYSFMQAERLLETIPLPGAKFNALEHQGSQW
jgi:hypothetical protein